MDISSKNFYIKDKIFNKDPSFEWQTPKNTNDHKSPFIKILDKLGVLSSSIDNRFSNIQQGRRDNFKELITLQKTICSFGVQVEICNKIIESASSLLRKTQN